ncbi:hybrid sensor histidine kinase/response regulator [Chamaesiphon minutus]|uniref:histidine kinase n=1 Tax=Chamaesiphon minutus (strain ATCC 27169 / PCC 6605) TaxID=1173020 RepID=K9UA18_CHAP6|nr:hybrid sensor histidine kinase/response regulator [Chamaesiphon minutus]AFY91947.1 chemotaxis protein histidine kinase-like protein [Chamaesiphon minutus PCC 6605]
MDNDNRIPLKFLDESEDCCDRIEATVLGLANTIPDPQAIDAALRAAHSVKGGAGMMGFAPLSHVAHQLEDFFKILRVRYHSKSISTEVETLLLAGVDCLRQVGDLHRRSQLVDETWLATQSQPIFDRLRQHLGDLRPEDEDALLSQEGDVDPGILLFESGVKESLDLLDRQFESLAPAELLQDLQMTADELSDFGRMASLDRFVDLCESIKIQGQTTSKSQVLELTRRAIKVWRKAHSLVILGRFDKIPDRLPEVSSNVPAQLELDAPVETLQEGFNPSLSGLESLDLSLLQSEITNLNAQTEADFTFSGDDIQPLELFSELAAFDAPEFLTDFDTDGDSGTLLLQDAPPLELFSELATFDAPEFLTDFTGDFPVVRQTAIPEIAPIPTASTPKRQSQTVRVPVEYLQQFNTAFGKLILERNAIDLRLSEIQNYTGLMRKRMKLLESSNQELRQWYDMAATQGLIPPTENTTAPANSNPILTSSTQGFDSLEMDRYNELHLVSQNQIETIVQLQEVTADIELSLQEMTRSVSSLNQTTRTLQVNLTRTQTIPFADVVKRFPRLIRDLSVQFGKSVSLTIQGENIGIDRAMLENLSDPLMHLLRNAFDHGIEDPATRMAAGKPTQGSIVLTASQRSGETMITIADDGGGVKLDRIRDRRQQMGLPATEVAKMPETQLLDVIFEPGFSTADNLTELSGRGVGMDVVRTNIEQVRGNIRIETQPGIGTTFIIRVPLTLSIIKVMLLERSGFVFAVSVDRIKEIIHFQPDLVTADGTKITWQSQEIPLIALEQGISFGRNSRTSGLPGRPTISQPTVLIVGEDRLLRAFQIDRYWGEQEVTLRSIDSPMPLTPGFGNSIILGDGRVVPLIDPIQFASWMSSKSDAPENPTPVTEQSSSSNAFTPNHPETNTILVIDDSINVRRYLAVMLEKEGYQVEQARDGQEAVEKLLAGLVVQAAICDIEMPRLDGYGVIEALRSNQDFEDLPILMLTSRNSEKHRMLAMNLGASAYFSKPYTESELLTTLKSLIQAAASKVLISSIR